jgi:hypothetical protein
MTMARPIRSMLHRRCRQLWRLLPCGWAGVWASVGAGVFLAIPAAALALEEPPLKAAIVYSLLQYVQWPDEAALAAGAPLALCAERQGVLWPHLSALNGRTVRQLRLELRDAADEPAARGCRAWVLEDGGRVPPQRGEAGLLTIGDGARADGAGIVIGLRRGPASRLFFDVDLVAARQQGLQVSSKMLRLARQVRE